jgi:hypothetical protein
MNKTHQSGINHRRPVQGKFGANSDAARATVTNEIRRTKATVFLGKWEGAPL